MSQESTQSTKIIFSKVINGVFEMSQLADETLSFIDQYLMSPEYNSNYAVVIALYGDLGAGKTTFTQVFAGKIGVTQAVNSPTFMIMKQYPVAHHSFGNLIHIDAYRLSEGGDLSKLGIETLLTNPQNLFCIEWPEIVSSILPKRHIKLEFEHIDEVSRKVTLSEVL